MTSAVIKKDLKIKLNEDGIHELKLFNLSFPDNI